MGFSDQIGFVFSFGEALYIFFLLLVFVFLVFHDFVLLYVLLVVHRFPLNI